MHVVTSKNHGCFPKTQTLYLKFAGLHLRESTAQQHGARNQNKHNPSRNGRQALAEWTKSTKHRMVPACWHSFIRHREIVCILL